MRGFYGSILNMGYLMLTRTMVLTLLAAAAAIATYLIGGVEMARVLAQWLVIVIFPMLTVWTARIAYASKWHIFEQSWPVSPAVMIISRYVLFAIIAFIVGVAWYFSPMFDGSFENLVHTIGSAYGALAVYYPLMYLLRGEKGDLDQILFIGTVIGAITGLGRFAIRFGTTPMVLLVAAAFFVSLVLSVGFNRLHKGRAA